MKHGGVSSSFFYAKGGSKMNFSEVVSKVDVYETYQAYKAFLKNA